MLSGGKMDQFLQAIYRQHQNAAYMNAAYLESYKELAKLQAQQEKELRRIESERAKKPKESDVMASSSVEDEIKGLCRICAGSIGPSGGGVPKIDLADPILNCLKIDIRQDTAAHPVRLCQSCGGELAHAMLQYSTMGSWPVLRVKPIDWTGQNSQNYQDCSLARTLPTICTIAAKHGFLLVPEHTDERRVRFVRLTELGSNDVSASFILHLYRDLTWDLSIHGHAVTTAHLLKTGLPVKVTSECAELFFTSVTSFKLCPGITGLDPICRIISQSGPAVFHDNDNKRLALEDRFARTVRHNECGMVTSDGSQCEACVKYQPVAKKFQESVFQEQYLAGIANLQKSESTSRSTSPKSSKRQDSDIGSDNDLESPSKKLKLGDGGAEPKINGDRRTSLSTKTSSDYKLSPLGSHPASGLSLLAESASRLPLTADRPNMREQLLAKAVEKKQACGRCDRCLRLDDCGQCDYCLDKPKFGGPNTKRRKCRLRTCAYFRQNQGGRRSRQSQNRNMMESASMVAAALNPSYMQKFTPSIPETSVEEKLDNCEKVPKSRSESSPTLDAPIGRRRPALQCHKCKHCASPDCAKCRFCLDKPKFGGPGRLKQKCIERRCILERQQDAEIRKEKERKAQNASLQKQISQIEKIDENVTEIKTKVEKSEGSPSIEHESEHPEPMDTNPPAELKIDEDEEVDVDVEDTGEISIKGNF